jgi:hypothetical protein
MPTSRARPRARWGRLQRTLTVTRRVPPLAPDRDSRRLVQVPPPHLQTRCQSGSFIARLLLLLALLRVVSD